LEKSKRLLFFSFALLVCTSLSAQINRYAVYFSDKTDSPFSVDRPEEFLSMRALERRTKLNIPVTEEDLPVNPAYLQLMGDLGIDYFFPSRWQNAVLTQMTETQLASVELLSVVDSVKLLAPGERLNARSQPHPRFDFGIERAARKSELNDLLQNEMLNIDDMHDQGLKGTDVLIAVLDGGFPGVDQAEAFSHLFDEGKLKSTFNFVTNDTNVFELDDHGTRVLSVLAAQDSSFQGAAYEADYMLFITEDVASEFRVEEYNWLVATERADSAGVDIIHSSLGYFDFNDTTMNYTFDQFDGETTLVAQAANEAAERGIVVVVSAGNEGNGSWKFITSPADSEHVLAVGAINDNASVASFSSIGPTADQRIKPDVVALGVGTSVVGNSGNITTSSGTSFSAPLVTGLAAGLWQADPDLTHMEIMDIIRRSGSNANNPDNNRGYGVPDFLKALEIKDNQIVTGLDEVIPKLFSVYPNPLKDDSFFIRPQENLTGNSILIKIYSSDGRLLIEEVLYLMANDRLFEFNTLKLSTGVYLLKIATEKHIETVRLIKS